MIGRVLTIVVVVLAAGYAIMTAVSWLRDDAVKDFVAEVAARQAADDAANLQKKEDIREGFQDATTDDLIDYLDRNGWLQPGDGSSD